VNFVGLFIGQLWSVTAHHNRRLSMSACKDVNWRFRPMALDVSEPDDQANLLASGVGMLVGVLGHAQRGLGAERH
jgi:hypothetical protein